MPDVYHLPILRVRGFHVDDGGTLSIHPYSFGY